MCVSGLILDPDVPISDIFTSPSTHDPAHSVTATPIVHPATINSTHSSTHLSRKGTLFHRLQTLYEDATRPFALSSSIRYTSPSVGATSVAASTATLVGPTPLGPQPSDTIPTPLKKKPSSSTTTVSAYPSQQQEILVLPFQFSMILARDVTRRNLPYLRHSWTRIDAVSVIAFWITFILAQTGVERGNHHIGLFRALSVLRTARLLTITSGTTVSDMARCAIVLMALTAGPSLLDHHALAQNRSSAACQRSIFCTLCRDFVFVCPSQPKGGGKSRLDTDFPLLCPPSP
jgi:voltage-dependent calcium channel